MPGDDRAFLIVVSADSIGADLVDPDPGQPGEPVELILGVVPGPGDDRPGRPPRPASAP